MINGCQSPVIEPGLEELIGKLRATGQLERSVLVITSDHGELFGEEGYFGHGPIQHDKVFEVPFVEGKLR